VDDSDAEFSVNSYGLPRSVILDHGTLSLDSNLIEESDTDLPPLENRFALSLIANDVFEDDITDICPDTSISGFVDDDLLWMAMKATKSFLLSRQLYMSGSEYINTCATVVSNANKSYSTLVEIIVALTHLSSTKYEWAAAAELMYSFQYLI